MSQHSFSTLGVPAPIVAALAADGKTEAFPIQVDTLPDTLAGRDVLGRGKTGSGKTLAFSIPMVARLSEAPAARAGHPRGLVLAPTRELATQIAATMKPLADAYRLRITTIFGGVSQNRQVSALDAGVDIVVACPGRLEDLMKQGHISLDQVEITVLDEADHMADLGFLPGVTRILKATPNGGQRLLFSATLDNGVDTLVKRFLHNQVLHSVDEANSPVATMTHHVFEAANPESKTALVRALASGTGRRILFMRTKHQAKKLAKQLTASGIPSVDLHGNLSQPARDRNLAAFGDGSARVLVATDVAARGVHVDHVELVVHVDPPAEHKAYLHRSGRTARAGAEGDVVTIMLPEQAKDVALLLRKASIKAAPQRVTAESTAVTALIGEVAPYVAPAAPVTGGAGNSSGRAGGSGRSGGTGGSDRAARASASGSGASGGSGGSRSRSRGGRGRGASGVGDSVIGGGSIAGATARAGVAERSGAATSSSGEGGGRRRARRGSGQGQARSNAPAAASASRSSAHGAGSTRAYSTSTGGSSTDFRAASTDRGQRRTGRRAQG